MQTIRSLVEQVLVPTYSPAEFVPDRGLGSKIWDKEGNEKIDFAGGIAVNSLGHCHPELVKALTDQANKLWHVSNALTNEPALKLAKYLTDHTFAERVFFCNSGAEANEAAFKLARKYSSTVFGGEKNQILSCKNAFHGRTLFTVSVGGQPKYTEGFGPTPEGIDHFEFNNLASLKAKISQRTCAVVVEPIQGEGGVVPADLAFLEGVRALCDEYQALLVFDEVQSGAGRTGSLYAYMDYGVCPDILTSAKGMGGGFPVGAMLTTEDVAKVLTVGTHGTTYGGNPLATAVALKVLEIINQPEVLNGVQARSILMTECLEKINQKWSVFKTIRGKGLLLGAVLDEAYVGKAKNIVKLAEQFGLLVLVAGMDVVRFAPSLIIPETDILDGMTRFEQAIEAFVFENKK